MPCMGCCRRCAIPRLSGTNVARDFVELPSQLYEHWLEEPQVLARFARHYQTGEALPQALLDKLRRRAISTRASPRWNSWPRPSSTWTFHSRSRGEFRPGRMQAASLARIGMPDEIVMRHAAPHFGHVFCRRRL